MAFVKIEDKYGEAEAILFPGAFQQTLGLWERDRVVLIRGKVSSKDRDGQPGTEIKIMVDDAREITVQQAEAYQATGKKLKTPSAGKKRSAAAATPPPASTSAGPRRVYIRMADSSNRELLMSLKQAIDAKTGDSEVVLILGADADRQIIRLPSRISGDEQSLNQLEELVGAGNVKYQ
jgi:DNA polymerase III alpha subunit